MVTTRIRYIVYTHSGGGVRHHHFGTQNNILAEANGHATSGDVLNALGIAVMPFNGNNLNFAFMSVNGAADGNHLYTEPGNQQVQVGSNNIDILVVYAPPGGIGSGGGPGIWLDAFNVDVGDFSDSLDFVKVLTPPTPPDTLDAAKTTFANQEGEVSTVNAETVRCFDHIDGAPFVKWKRITGSPLIQTDRQLNFAAGQSGEIWFAFYQTPPKPDVHIPKVIDAVSAGIFLWTGDDTCGNGGHWVFPKGGGGPGPGGPFRINIQKSVLARLNADQKKQLETLQKEYPAAAKAGLDSMTKALDMINKINNIIGKAGH